MAVSVATNYAQHGWERRGEENLGAMTGRQSARTFTYSQSNPFSHKSTGFITGAGHSATFADKQGPAALRWTRLTSRGVRPGRLKLRSTRVSQVLRTVPAGIGGRVRLSRQGLWIHVRRSSSVRRFRANFGKPRSCPLVASIVA